MFIFFSCLNIAYKNWVSSSVYRTPALRARMTELDGEDNAEKLEIAIRRKDSLVLMPMEIRDGTRMCINCNLSIASEILQPYWLRFNVVTQTSRHSSHDISVLANVRVCRHYLDEEDFVL